MEQQLKSQAEAELIQGVRLVLKRRQKYMYDYFFPKNMRDLQEQQSLHHKYNSTT